MKKLVLLFAVLGSLAAAQSDPAQEALDREQIIGTVDAIGIYADADRWDLVAEQFADEVVIDYTSYATASAGAAEPKAITPQEVVTAWQSVLPGYDYTQHIIGNHQVELNGDEATAVSNVHATHVLEGEHWIFLGDYEHHLVRTDEGWKVDQMTANMRAELGNSDLPDRATARVEAGEGRLSQ